MCSLSLREMGTGESFVGTGSRHKIRHPERLVQRHAPQVVAREPHHSWSGPVSTPGPAGFQSAWLHGDRRPTTLVGARPG